MRACRRQENSPVDCFAGGSREASPASSSKQNTALFVRCFVWLIRNGDLLISERKRAELYNNDFRRSQRQRKIACDFRNVSVAGSSP